MSADTGGDAPLYPWMAAPAHLKTRRQLRAQGRAPGRQDIAGRMETRRRGQTVVAYLFDITKSTPARHATPAQREALAHANRERQIRAAERRGYTRADLTEISDPGPGWDSSPPADPQVIAAAELLHLRADSAHHTLAGLHASPEVLAAVAAWRGPHPGADPAAYLADAPHRHARMHDYLSRLDPHGPARRQVDTVLGYLESSPRTTDLLTGPVLVSPADSMRGRANALLARLARSGPAFAPVLLARIAPMPATDQHEIRVAAGRLAWGLPVQPLWPDHLDREQAATWIREYARLTRLVAEGTPGMQPGLDRARGRVEALFDLQGMHELEAARLAGLVAEIEAHHRDDRSLPPQLWADEHTRHQLDDTLHVQRATALGTSTVETALALLADPDGNRPPAVGIEHAVRALGEDLTSLARGHNAHDSYNRHRDRLARTLAGQQIPAATHRHLHELFTTGAHQALRIASIAQSRETAWTRRLATGPPPPSTTSTGLIGVTRPKTSRTQQGSPQPTPLPEVGVDHGAALDNVTEP
ncbi:hypothetical protein [Nocardia sp. NBC_00511]|uniref:hypothetical protein n=1 Tax=Nocardia sp. NBC_00511 TaxID=2903591 RepID=UPI002F9095B2